MSKKLLRESVIQQLQGLAMTFLGAEGSSQCLVLLWGSGGILPSSTGKELPSKPAGWEPHLEASPGVSLQGMSPPCPHWASVTTHSPKGPGPWGHGWWARWDGLGLGILEGFSSLCDSMISAGWFCFAIAAGLPWELLVLSEIAGCFSAGKVSKQRSLKS